MMETWGGNSNNVAEEHRLLGQTLRWLSRFGTIPENYFQGSLLGQPFPPPTLVAQMEGKHNLAEFWSALGIAPRPAFTLVVTIAMELDDSVSEGPPVATKKIQLEQEVFFEIAGTVKDTNFPPNPINGAEITLIEVEKTLTTNEKGQFRFADLEAGSYTLQATATGFTQQNKTITVPNTVLNQYDLSLTP